MGLEVRMEPGPVFPAPLASPKDFARLTLKPDIASSFAPLFEGISLVRRQAAAALSEGGCGKAVPVIGFCGAPWTLMSYMVGPGGRAAPAAPEGAPHGSKKDSGAERTRAWLFEHPAASHELLAALTEVCIELLLGCWRAGASILQVFESGAGDLPPALFAEFCLPYLLRIAEGVRARAPAAAAGGPALIVFPRGQHSAAGLEGLCASAYDAIGLDWGWEPSEAAARVAAECARLGLPCKALQGNLDPAALLAPPRQLLQRVRDMLAGFGGAALVANLGHGMLPGHDPEQLALFLEAVGCMSEEMRRGGAVGEELLDRLEKKG